MNNTTHHNTRGAALLLFVLFFLFGSSVLVFGVARGVYQSLAEYKTLEKSKRGYFAAEAGIEDAIYRHRDSRLYSNNETFTIDGVTASTSRVLVVDVYEITAEGNAAGAVRKSKISLAVGDGASFNFGLQSGNGGISMSNSSSVRGNVFSNGVIEGQGSAIVYGDVIASGPSGLIDSLHATGTTWSHFIDNSVVDGDAHYFDVTTRTATIVNGTSYPGTADQATATMPITDQTIEEWKTNIVNTGTVIASTSAECLSGTYTINSDTELNNVKIECNVDMRKQGAGTTITIAGPVWIEGNLAISQGPAIVASSSLGSKSVQVIVDKEVNRATSSTITINQSTTFTSGNAQSYVLLLSMNDDATNGGGAVAINLAQSASGKVLVYAPHGRVDMGNSISLKEVTAYQIDINNGAEVIYESGLVNMLFTSGPGGGYTVLSWEEVE